MVWVILAVIVLGCIGYAAWFLTKKDKYAEDKTEFKEAPEGGDDMYYRFIDNEISQ